MPVITYSSSLISSYSLFFSPVACVSKISKVFGCISCLFTVPMDLDVKVKATLLGACFLIVSQVTVALAQFFYLTCGYSIANLDLFMWAFNKYKIVALTHFSSIYILLLGFHVL